MSKKIRKEDILNEIANKIKVCEEYQCKDPDSTAKERVEIMKNDQCNCFTYYVNMTLKNCIPQENLNLSDRLKYVEKKRYLPLAKELDDAFNIGCIITVNIQEKGFSMNVSQTSTFSETVEKLIPSYLDQSTAIYSLNPKSSASDIYIMEDIKAAKESGKNKIVYSIASFKKDAIEDFLKKQYDKEKYDLQSYFIQNFEEVGYVDMTRKTSSEQNINASFGNPGILNSVTLFNQKSNLPDYNLKKKFGVYDMGVYINGVLNEIKASDKAQARKKYQIYSKDIFKDYEESKYDTYKANGGNTTWATWTDAQGQYLTYKSISSVDEKFKEEGLNNSAYKNNLRAYEIASDFFLNSPMESIEKLWKTENEYFKKLPVSTITFTGEPSATAKGNANSLIQQNMVDPPSVVVKPYDGNIEFKDDILYNFSLTVNGDNKKDSASINAISISDPSGSYERVNGFFKSNNLVPIKRDLIKLDGIIYEYTNVEIKIDKNDVSFTDDLTQKSGYYTVPEKYYYNSTYKIMFESAKLSKRLTQAAIIYNIVPKSITVPVKFIQHSYWNNFEPAEEARKKLEKEYDKKYKRLCVDSIPYDPWERLISHLEILYAKWSKVCPDKNGLIEIPPVDDETTKSLTCELCQKNNEECTCNKIKFCTKNFPINLYGDPNESKFYSLFDASTYIFNLKDEALTFAEIAKEIYHLICQKEDVNDTSKFIKKDSPEVETVLGAIYENLVHSYTFKMDNSLLSQMSEGDFEAFIKQYEKILSEDPIEAMNQKFIKKLPVGLMNGILYVPTGHYVSFEYSLDSHSLRLEGANETIMNEIKDLNENYSGVDFINILGKTLEKYKDIIRSENVKKFIAFPYLPDMNKILTSEENNEQTLKSEYEEDFTYMINSFDLNNIKNNPYGLKNIPVRFYVYLKKAVICSYPRCKDSIYETDDSNGICGLNEFFRSPIIISASSFLLENELRKRNIRRKMNKLKEYSIKLVDNITKIRKSACDSEKNLHMIEIIILKALDALYEFERKYNDELIQYVPKDELDEKAKMAVICTVAKAAKEKSIMNDYDIIFSNTIRAVLPMTDDFYNVSEYEFNSAISELNSCKNGISEYFNEISKKGKNFNMCSVKFADYIDNLEEYIELINGIIEVEKADIEKKLEKIIVSRCTNHNIYEKTKKLELKESDTLELAKMISNGNIEGVKAFVRKNENLIKDKENGEIVKIQEDITVLNKFTEISDSTKNLANTLIMEAKKYLNKQSIAKPFTSSISKEYQDFGKMTENIMSSIESTKSDVISNQSSDQVKKKIKDDSPASISNDIIINMFQYITERSEDYRKITNEIISYD